MKALTLHQPWAAMIADGRKRYETRSWPPPRALIGQRIAIHAGLSFDSGSQKLAEEWGYNSVDMRHVGLGVIVCTARLVAAHLIWGEHRMTEWHAASTAKGSIESKADPDYEPQSHLFQIDEFGDYAAGRWSWRLVDVETVNPPLPARGRQGLWQWSGP